MRGSIVILILSLFLTHLNAQELELKEEYLEPITKTELRKHIEILASDSLEGRFTASEGQIKAAHYIKNQFSSLQLHPYNDTTFYQSFNMWQWHWGKCAISYGDTILVNNEDMVYQSYSPIEPAIEAKCVFIGNGTDSIVAQLNLEGKVAFAYINNLSRYYSINRLIRNKGAKALIIANPNNDEQFNRLIQQVNSDNSQQKIFKDRPSFSAYSSKTFAVKASFAELLFETSEDDLLYINDPKTLKKLPTPSISLSCPIIIEPIETQNIVGYIKAKEPTEETIVVSAHYDHIGKKGKNIYNGADDNASGTSALITLAKAFQNIPEKLDRNILFLATTGEELGLLGALHFAEQQKQLPFEVKANFNIDMIGRNDSIDKENYLYLIGASHYPLLDSICRVANQSDSLTLHKEYKRGYGSFINLSDHYAFHKQGIPILGFFSGLHTDYHQTSDTIDKIEFEAMQKRVELIFRTIFLACQTEILK
ncbi:M28 family peptidase [Carboxylicivirga sp. N1Y90]|uniref:M28 family peptidase n=1 Tax=Carboxylicivirga fragile TaxID=3417571 RepID=UPI003D327741|nr:M28 family peptidase [Marinilabiliaceae bacterium N1Y90]